MTSVHRSLKVLVVVSPCDVMVMSVTVPFLMVVRSVVMQPGSCAWVKMTRLMTLCVTSAHKMSVLLEVAML